MQLCLSPIYVKDRKYLKDIKKEIGDNGLDENIILTGYRSDIANLINAIDVLIHSSIKPEPFGRVIIEGMCLEKPVIATDIGGPREIIKNGVSGILVPPGDAVVLSSKIAYLLNNPEISREIGVKALMRVKKKFGLEQFS